MSLSSVRDAVLRPHKVHGLLFDGGVFVSGAFFLRFVPRIGDDTPPRAAGLLLGVAILAQILGAVLKRGPLGRRLSRNPQRGRPGCARTAMNGLLFLHFILFTVMAVLALASLGVIDLARSDGADSSEYGVLIGFGVGGLATLSVAWAERGEGDGEGIAPRMDAQELLADGLLWVSVTIVTQMFWAGLVNLIEPRRGAGLGWIELVLLLAMSALFCFFYLPCRYLFLAEDYHSRLTWVQAWLAMLPVAWMVLVG